MSEKSVYDHEMLKKRFSDRDVERALSGGTPESLELARLAPALETLHADRPSAPSEEAIARYAAEAARIARSAAPAETDAPGATTSTPGRGRAFRRRFVVLATAALTFAAMTGVAFAADSAAPGDPLYGIDRALEKVGINDGGAGERLTEALELTEEGRIADAIHHVAETVETPDGEGAASDALRAAADRVEKSGNDASESVRAAVAAMLEAMADMADDPEVEGAEFGGRVSQMAREISETKPDNTPGAGDTGPPESPASNQDQKPAGDTGVPEDIEPPKDKDEPGDQGNSDNQGPPPDRGSSGDQGPPEDPGQPERPGGRSSSGKP